MEREARGRARVFGSIARLWPLFAVLAASGCDAVGPDYLRPAASISVAYKDRAGWKLAEPRDGAAKGEWWRVFKDAELDRLEPDVALANPSVAASEASYREALALISQARSQLFPLLDFNPSAARDSATGTEISAQAGVSWTLDIWGKTRREIEQASANAEASAAALGNARLASQAALALAYIALRQADSLGVILQQTLSEYRKTLKVTEDQFKEGTTDVSSVLRARVQILNVQSQAVQADIARGLAENAIAILIGRPPADLQIARGALATFVPEVPVGLPSALLERRPDIAAAERRMAAANAAIGVAFAGYFPNLSLTGSFGYANSAAATKGAVIGSPIVAQLAGAAANPVWAFGASVAQTLFNGGLTAAQVEAARAAYDASVAAYRETVLTALQGVENQLLTARKLAAQQRIQREAIGIARQASDVALNEYRAGEATYIVVSEAQATLLADLEAELATRAARLTAAANLIVGLGGGWRDEPSP